MALDGIVISNLVYEFNNTILGGRINKIAQPEADELMLTIKNNRTTYKLLLSANASIPVVYLTEKNKTNPMTAPNFCMLLRKHLNSARIIEIKQPGLERIINIKIEHLNEMGDICEKYLIVEIMGKHSNIIFCDDKWSIIDSIKHISSLVSSVREVLPNRPYFIAETVKKENPLEIEFDAFKTIIKEKCCDINKALYKSLTGISPVIANELCMRASIEPSCSVSALSENEMLHLFKNFERFIEDVRNNEYFCNIIYDEDNVPLEFSSIKLLSYSDKVQKEYDSISLLLEDYYFLKSTISRIRQKSFDIRKVVNNAIERANKKYVLQKRQLKDTEKRDKLKIYGELINTYGYNVENGAKSFKALNYYTNEEITIPLDSTITPLENAKKYFDKYNKLKRTYEALIVQTEETQKELEHLESISNALDIAMQENDLVDIKNELIECGYIKKRYSQNKKGKKKESKNDNKPLHYISSDGFHIYVGKNNYQNDELTFNFAVGNDWWFHAKGIAGSHVIVKTNGEELPDQTFEEAGRLAAYYSKGKSSGKVEIDYIEKKHIKKPNGSKPGFVVYYTNYSLVAKADITGIEQII